MFQWGPNKHIAFDTLKDKITTTLFLALPDPKQTFEIKTDAKNYAMGTILKQHGKPICYHFETFTNAIINYPIYD